jgi:hypothetical protein
MKTFFSLIRSNGVSKNPSLHNDIKNVDMTLGKSAPEKSFGTFQFSIGKIVFWLKLFLGGTFYKGHMNIFEISTKRQIF